MPYNDDDIIANISIYLTNVCHTHLTNKKESNIDTITSNIVRDFVDLFEEEYGGQNIYIRLNSSSKKQRIYNDFNGFNYNEIAKKYKITTSYTRRIIKQIQKENRKNQPRQGSLFE